AGAKRLRRLGGMRVHAARPGQRRPEGLARRLRRRLRRGRCGMRVLITGANGYIGRALAERLCALPGVPGHGALEQLTLCDLAFDAAPADPRVRQGAGDFADPATLAAITDPPPDLVFHLACVASGRAELEFELGLRVNLEGSLRLLERLRRQGR